MSDYSVYPRKDSPYWWIAYISPTTLRRTAESSRQRTDDPLGYKRALDLVRRKAEDGRAMRLAGRESSWDGWVEPWFRQKFSTAAQARSLKAELHRWRFVRAFLHERKLHSPAGVTYQLGIDFLAWRQAHKTRGGKGSYNNALGELRLLGRIMREAVRRGFVAASPLERMGFKRQKSPEKPEISADELTAIRAALAEREGHLPITQQWMTVSFEIALHQGCRHAETSLHLADGGRHDLLRHRRGGHGRFSVWRSCDRFFPSRKGVGAHRCRRCQSA